MTNTQVRKEVGELNKNGLHLLFWAIVAILLYSLTHINFNVFHLTIEILIIIAGTLIFMVSRISHGNQTYALTRGFGNGLFAVSFMVLLHALTYEGMNVFIGYDTNLPTQLWIALNIVLVLNVLLFTILGDKTIKWWKLFGFFTALGGILTWLCFARIFPDCYVKGVGITPFKKIMEYLFIAIYLFSLGILYKRKQIMPRASLYVNVAVIFLLSLSGFVFTLYSNVDGLISFMGHYLRLLAFGLLLYYSIMDNIMNPYNKLYKNLIASEQQFRTMFEGNNAVMLLINPKNGAIILANPAASDFYGWSEEEFKQKKIYDINLKSDQEIDEDMQRALNGDRERFYFRHQTASGDIRDVIVDSSPVSIDGEKVLYSIISDHTDRLKAENSLKESENNFKLMFEDAPLPYQSLNEDGDFITINNAWLEMMGYEREEVIGESFSKFICPNFSQQFKTNFPYFKERGEIGTVFEMPTKAGKILAVHFQGRISYNADGSFRQTHCILRDITESLESQRRLSESELKHKALIANISDVIGILDTDFRVKYISENITALFDWHTEDLLGDIFFGTVYPGDLERVQEWFEVILNNSGKISTTEFRYLCKDNSYKYIQLTARNMDDDPIIDGILINYSDITDRKKLEDERETTQAILVNHQKLESIGTLASGVAHEINNPINGIMNYSQIILDTDCEDQEIIESATQIIRETKRVSIIVKNLLEFSRQNTKHYQKHAIKEVIDRTLSLVRTLIKRDQIALEVEIDDDLPEINCIGEQIQQVLMNLIINAKDALNDKYPDYNPDKRIIIRCMNVEDTEGQWVRVAVEDFGNGIPAEIKDRIFDPFYTTKERHKGTGLGLSISYGIINEHDGRISFESEIGQNTIFYFDLPIDTE